MSTSVIPATLDALRDLFRESCPQLQIGDGSLLQPETDFLIVGYNEGNAPALSGSRAAQDLARVGDREVFSVACLLSCWDGDTDASQTRSRLFGYFDALDTALVSSPSDLGVPGLMLARIDEFEMQQQYEGEGSTATLAFTVRVDAWRQ